MNIFTFGPELSLHHPRTEDREDFLPLLPGWPHPLISYRQSLTKMSKISLVEKVKLKYPVQRGVFNRCILKQLVMVGVF